MCRSIRTLRPPFTETVTTGDVEAAARQYVRKLAGFRAPSAQNQAVFDAAIAEVAEATRRLLEGLDVQGRPPVAVVDGPEQPPRRAVTQS